MDRRERRLAAAEGRQAKPLQEVDYLLGVSDKTGQMVRRSKPDVPDRYTCWKLTKSG
jgi:hypothetical protein